LIGKYGGGVCGKIIANLMLRLLKRRAIRFVIIGTINTAFSYAIYAFFLHLGLSYLFANLLALMISILFSFKTQGKFVFKSTENHLLWRFIVAWLLIYFVNVFLINMLMRLGLNAYISGALAIFPVTGLSYFFQRFYVFRRPAPTY
jgi:putative flippase GtrA